MTWQGDPTRGPTRNPTRGHTIPPIVYLIAASAFQWVQALAGAIAALAALGALLFAWLTVRGAQALRRDERRAHLLDLAADLVEAGLRALQDSRNHNDALIARQRFRGQIDATAKPLPACRALLEMEWFPPMSMGADAERRTAAAHSALAAALEELSAWLRD